MKVLLIQIDGKMPNKALMQFSAHHKKLGDETALMRLKLPDMSLLPFEPDCVYASCIFDWNRGYAFKLIEMFRSKVQGLQIGGYGVNGSTLPDFIEHLMPDYDLYGIDYSMGFTSRGCFRNCSWCIVPKKEGGLRDHAPINEFLHPNHNKLILFDNNFLASPKWKKNLKEIINKGIKVCFTQGLDIRLINYENAVMLADCFYYDWKFKERRLYFSFDQYSFKMEKNIRDKIEILEKAGIPSKHLMFYVLCGYNSTHAEDMSRFEVLDELGVDPFIMKYNNRRDDSWLNHFTRWVNKRRYKVCDWNDYDHGNSQEIINVVKGEKKL